MGWSVCLVVCSYNSVGAYESTMRCTKTEQWSGLCGFIRVTACGSYKFSGIDTCTRAETCLVTVEYNAGTVV